MYIDGVNLPDPSTERELADLLAEADRAHLGVTPKGAATKQDWGNPPSRACFYLSTAKLNRVLEHAWADMTVTVEAGCTFGVLQATLAEHGQRLTADPLWPEKATVGGMLATNDTGALRLMYGGLRDLIIGITLALPDGTLAKSGGKVVKNVAGYDLMKLATGALGTLGVITQATFRVYPLPRESRCFTARFSNPAAAGEFVVRVLAEPLAITSMQVRGSEVDILIEGTQAGIAAQHKRIREFGKAEPSDASIFEARQKLWDKPGAIAKISVVPSKIAEFASADAVFQATGIGWMRVSGGLAALRSRVVAAGGSLNVLRPDANDPVDAWGDTSALGLMKAVKRQFDPHGTLNPGRFVGGI